MKTQFHTKLLILGASAFACGAAWEKPEDVLIAEPGILIAPEFSATLNSAVPTPPQTDAGKALLKSMTSKGKTASSFLISDYLALRLLEKKCRVMLNTVPVSLKRENGIWGAELAARDGVYRVSAERVLDTSAEGWNEQRLNLIAEKNFRAMLYGPGVKEKFRGAELIPENGKREQILKIDLPPDSGWHEARLRFHDLYAEIRKTVPETTITAECFAMTVKYREPDLKRSFGEGGLWIPSTQYPDFMKAFEEGLKCVWA